MWYFEKKSQVAFLLGLSIQEGPILNWNVEMRISDSKFFSFKLEVNSDWKILSLVDFELKGPSVEEDQGGQQNARKNCRDFPVCKKCQALKIKKCLQVFN